MGIVQRLRDWWSDARTVSDGVGLAGRITVREYAVADIPRYHDIPSKRDRFRVVSRLEPRGVSVHHNIVQNEFIEYLVDVHIPGSAQSLEDISHFAVGTDSTTPKATDGGLLSETLRTQLQSETDAGKDFEATGFLDSTEANGNTLVETSLETKSSGGHSVNRAVISDIDKTSSKLATIDFTIELREV